jgi:hypothetical protein
VQPHARVMCDAQQNPAVIGQEAPALHRSEAITVSRIKLLVFHCLPRVGAGTGDQPPAAASHPGSPEGAGHDLIGLIIIAIALMVLLMLEVSGIRQKLQVPKASRRGRPDSTPIPRR